MDEQVSLCSASGFSMLSSRKENFAMRTSDRVEKQANFTGSV